jgi:hypothetical protein
MKMPIDLLILFNLKIYTDLLFNIWYWLESFLSLIYSIFTFKLNAENDLFEEITKNKPLKKIYLYLITQIICIVLVIIILPIYLLITYLGDLIEYEELNWLVKMSSLIINTTNIYWLMGAFE